MPPDLVRSSAVSSDLPCEPCPVVTPQARWRDLFMNYAARLTRAARMFLHALHPFS
jgi:hypothetical protein